MSPLIQQLQDEVTQVTTVEASAVTLINGIVENTQAQIQQALENGATAEQLQPIADSIASLKSATDALAAAVAANTPAAPTDSGAGATDTTGGSTDTTDGSQATS